MTKKRRRPIHLHVMVSEAEQALIQERMAEAGIRNRVRQMKFTVQAQHLQYRQFLFTFLFHIRTSLSIATVRLPPLGSRSLRAAICLRQLCRIFHLLGNRTGPVGIIRRRTQLIVGCLFFR